MDFTRSNHRDPVVVAVIGMGEAAVERLAESLDELHITVSDRLTASDRVTESERISYVQDANIDVLVWDFGWGFDTSAPMAPAAQTVPVLALVRDPDTAAQAWRLGASGVLRSDRPDDAIGVAILALAAGLKVMDPEMPVPNDAGADADLDEAFAGAALGSQLGSIAAPLEDLTVREKEVLQLIAHGLTNREIGEHLSISENTVKYHVNAILGKLDARTRTEAAIRGSRLGLV